MAENNLIEITKAEQILRLRLQGKTPDQIALEVNTDKRYVYAVIKEKMEETQIMLSQHAEQILGMDLARVEFLIDHWMPEAMISLPALREMVKLIRARADIITRIQPKIVKIQGDKDNPIEHVMEHVFSANSEEYQQAVQFLQAGDKEAMKIVKETEEDLSHIRLTSKEKKDLEKQMRDGNTDFIEGLIEEYGIDPEADV